MIVQPVYSKRPRPLLWVGSRTASVKLTSSGIPNHLNYCVTCSTYASYKCAGGPQLGAPCPTQGTNRRHNSHDLSKEVKFIL